MSKPIVEPLLLRAGDTAKLLSVGKTKFYQMHSAGLIPAPIMLDGCARWSVEELRRWLTAGAPAREKWLRMRQALSSKDIADNDDTAY